MHDTLSHYPLITPSLPPHAGARVLSIWTKAEFVAFIGECLRRCQYSMECVFLNMCCSERLASAIRDAHKGLTVISWRSKVDDKAAIKFAQGFFEHIGRSPTSSPAIYRSPTCHI